MEILEWATRNPDFATLLLLIVCGTLVWIAHELGGRGR